MKFNFSPFPILDCQEIQLRAATIADYNELFHLRSDQDLNRYITRTPPSTKLEVEEWLAKITRGIEKGENIYWAISLKDNPAMIGSICLWNFSPNQKIGEVGYDLLQEFQGRGIMTSAMACVLQYGFNQLGLQQIEAYTHRDNAASLRLLHKFGFQLIENRTDKDNPNNLIYALRAPETKG